MTDNIATGYFGVPGSSKGRFTVHVINNGKPLCGWKPRSDMAFQWCAHGVQWTYIECDRCREKSIKYLPKPFRESVRAPKAPIMFICGTQYYDDAEPLFALNNKDQAEAWLKREPRNKGFGTTRTYWEVKLLARPPQERKVKARKRKRS